MTAKKKSPKTAKKKSKSTKVKEESVSLDEQLKHEKDKNLRLFAEFDNFRKRTAKERIELFGTASQDIMTSLLPILDNFERAFKLNEPSENDGMLLIYNQLKAELDKKGLKEIENPIGKELDTDFHEAITNIPAQDKKQKGKIVDVIEKGYLLSTKVLRYAKVVVAN
ncbi:MAG: nucleotide exchange factor GrpE [Flavobacteriales bacterium]|nr:nucleotide exchange factor GrpE [Flavobacteriales bacterium]